MKINWRRDIILYLDANVFIYAMVGEKPKKEICRKLLKEIEDGAIKGEISVLVLDEVFWAISKLIERKAAMSAWRNIINLPVKILNIDEKVAFHAADLLEKYSLRPRDSIHAAIAEINGIPVVSDDKDFDKIEGLKRIEVERIFDS